MGLPPVRRRRISGRPCLPGRQSLDRSRKPQCRPGLRATEGSQQSWLGAKRDRAETVRSASRRWAADRWNQARNPARDRSCRWDCVNRGGTITLHLELSLERFQGPGLVNEADAEPDDGRPIAPDVPSHTDAWLEIKGIVLPDRAEPRLPLLNHPGRRRRIEVADVVVWRPSSA